MEGRDASECEYCLKIICICLFLKGFQEAVGSNYIFSASIFFQWLACHFKFVILWIDDELCQKGLEKGRVAQRAIFSKLCISWVWGTFIVNFKGSHGWHIHFPLTLLYEHFLHYHLVHNSLITFLWPYLFHVRW